MKRYQKCQNVHSTLLDDVSGCEWDRKKHFWSENTSFFSSIEVCLENSLLRSFWRTLRCSVSVIFTKRNMWSLSFLRKTGNGYKTKFTYYWDVQKWVRECSNLFFNNSENTRKIRCGSKYKIVQTHTHTHLHTWYGTARRPHPACLCTPVHIALCQTVQGWERKNRGNRCHTERPCNATTPQILNCLSVCVCLCVCVSKMCVCLCLCVSV